MKFSLISGLTIGLSTLQLASARYVMYVDQFHLTDLPNRTVTAGIDTVIMAFANSSLFVGSGGDYTPFMPVSTMRSRFDAGTKVLLALGGWGDTDGFSAGALTAKSRLQFAKNVAKTIDRLGFDGVELDWEFPGGNGADYKQKPNSGKVSQITTYPLLLAAIKCEIRNKLLSIAVPALERDMIAYTPEKALQIWASVDFVNIMTYDFMNRRDNITTHHTSVAGSLKAINYYLDVLHLPPWKANLGFAFYAKYFTVDANSPCTTGLGCETVLLENADGSDTGKSSAITFEKANYASAPTNLTVSTDGSCGASVFHFCPTGFCCSQFGFCGDTPAHCDSSCQPDYGICSGASIPSLFKKAMANGIEDSQQGGEYYYDKEHSIFWTWDTPKLIARKFEEVVKRRGLGGVMAWSAGQDSQDWSHMLALQKGVKGMKKIRFGA